MDNYLLKCDNVCYVYHTLQGEIPAIDHLSFAVRQGEFVSIVGPSGCGKSTLLNLLTGLLRPEQGSIVRCDERRNNADFYGYMLQQDQLFEWYTIWENVTLGLRINHNLTDEKRQYIEALLEKYQLLSFKDNKPSSLSGGMRQRAALIRTLAMEPELLILDEPFSALDYQSRLSVADDIGQIIRQENKTAILVTHDIGEAISLSSRVLILSKRPAHLIKEVSLPFRERNLSPLAIRHQKDFSDYFNLIWKELNDSHVSYTSQKANDLHA